MQEDIHLADSNGTEVCDQTEDDNTMYTVFVLSEDMGVQSALVLLLASAGFRAVGFDTAMTFLTAAFGEKDCRCVVIHHHLPGGADGLSILECFAAMGTKVPAIIASNRADAAFARQAIKAGAVTVLVKPLLDDALLDSVASAMGIRWSGN